jgi:opacity protein-like surface antigen
MIRPVLALSVLFALAAAPLSAQGAVRSNTKGLLLGAGFAWQSIEVDEFSDDSESGMGLDLNVGWGFTPKFAVLVDLSAVSLDDDEGGEDIVLAHFDLLARYSFANAARAFVPYIEAGFNGRALAQDDADVDGEIGDLSLTGSGLSLGGGVQYFMTPKWALNANLKWTNGEFNEVEFENVSISGLDIDATTTRLTLGVTWYPMANRTP